MSGLQQHATIYPIRPGHTERAQWCQYMFISQR